jgi:hypothetical protein
LYLRFFSYELTGSDTRPISFLSCQQIDDRFGLQADIGFYSNFSPHQIKKRFQTQSMGISKISPALASLDVSPGIKAEDNTMPPIATTIVNNISEMTPVIISYGLGFNVSCSKFNQSVIWHGNEPRSARKSLW